MEIGRVPFFEWDLFNLKKGTHPFSIERTVSFFWEHPNSFGIVHSKKEPV